MNGRHHGYARWMVAGLLLSGPALTLAADTMQMERSSVRIICTDESGKPKSTGSGFLVGSAGMHVVTNSHVVQGCGGLMVFSPRDSGEAARSRAQLLWDSKSSNSKRFMDAAILKLDSSLGGKGVVFAGRNTVQVQDVVTAVGYPGAADEMAQRDEVFRPSITPGVVSRRVKLQADGAEVQSVGIGGYQITASIGPGSSGGPLYNDFGEVVGINTTKALVAVASMGANGSVAWTRVPLQDGVSMAQEVDDLLPILGENGIDYHFNPTRRNWFWLWVNRDPVTASAVGVVVALLLVVASGLLLRRSQPVGPDHPMKLQNQNQHNKRPDSERRHSAHVIGMAGPYSGKRFPMTTDLVFGRDPRSCSVVFSREHDGIGSRHCSLRFDAASGQFELRDLGSANGTFVDGKRLEPSTPRRLRDGQEFYLFKSKYRFAVHLDRPVHPLPDEGTTGVGGWKPQ